MKHSNEISNMPWAGNYHMDANLFKACEAYARGPYTSQEEQLNTLHLMMLHGMGIDKEVTPKDLQSFMAG